MPIVHFFDAPDRIVVGTVGAPGQRAFFLQVRSGLRTTTVGCEKQQVQILAERIEEFLYRLRIHPEDLRDDDPLEFPITEEFRAGTMTLDWAGDTEVVVLEVFSSEFLEADLTDLTGMVGEGDEEDEDDDREILLVHMSARQARAFARRARIVVAGGRPDCPFCGEPVDPAGHLCVRANGFRRRTQ